MENNSLSSISTNLSGFVKPTYAYRNMKIYAVPENELMMISSTNTLDTIFFSAGSFFLSFALAIFLGAIYAGNLKYNIFGKVLFYYGTPSLVIIAIVFLVCGGCMIHRKNILINTIKNESIIQDR